MPPSILAVGLPWNSKHLMAKFEGKSIDTTWLKQALEDATNVTKSAGYDCETLLFDPENINLFKAKLQERRWDGVVIGYGVKGNPDLTRHFEDVIEVVREQSYYIKLGFNWSPGSTVDAARRMFPLGDGEVESA